MDIGVLNGLNVKLLNIDLNKVHRNLIFVEPQIVSHPALYIYLTGKCELPFVGLNLFVATGETGSILDQNFKWFLNRQMSRAITTHWSNKNEGRLVLETAHKVILKATLSALNSGPVEAAVNTFGLHGLLDTWEKQKLNINCYTWYLFNQWI